MAKSWLPLLGIVGFALSACGHGGGGSGGAGGISVPFQATGSTVAYQAPAGGGPSSASAQFQSGTGIPAGSSGAVPADTAGNTVTITTTTSGAIGTLSINIATAGGGPTVSQAFAGVNQGTTTLSATQFAALLAAISTSPATTANAVYQGTVAGLSSSAYGAWMQSIGGGSYNVGLYTVGVETAVMPTAGTATYNGTALGFGANGTTPFAFNANVNMTTNFATNSVTGLTFSNFATHDVNDNNPGPAITSITGVGAIVGNKYSVAIAGSGLTGTANGMFFGPTANETAGTFRAANGGSTFTIVGGYGAHQ